MGADSGPQLRRTQFAQKRLQGFIRSDRRLFQKRQRLFDAAPLLFRPLPAQRRGQPRLVPFLGQTEIGIVVTQQQAVFRPRRHDPIRLVRSLGHQIVDQHADIAFRTADYDRRPVFHPAGGIEAGDQSLRRRFFIA